MVVISETARQGVLVERFAGKSPPARLGRERLARERSWATETVIMATPARKGRPGRPFRGGLGSGRAYLYEARAPGRDSCSRLRNLATRSTKRATAARSRRCAR